MEVTFLGFQCFFFCDFLCFVGDLFVHIFSDTAGCTSRPSKDDLVIFSRFLSAKCMWVC